MVLDTCFISLPLFWVPFGVCVCVCCCHPSSSCKHKRTHTHTHTHKITTKHSQSGSCPQYNFSLHHQRTQLIKNNPPLSRILSLETGCNPNSLSLASSPPLSHSLTLVLINQQTAQLLPAQPTSDGRRKSCQSPLYGCSTGQHQSSHYDAAN